ncbi:hypothetical protein HDE_00679 [Halotydeus destructor]|nr:hypothetical protein HDE_00679 [Halotydeus destructor]
MSSHCTGQAFVPDESVTKMRQDIRRLLGERYGGCLTETPVKKPLSAPSTANRTGSRTVQRPKSAGQPGRSANKSLPQGAAMSDVQKILIDKINEVATWEAQIRFEFEFRLELMEKEFVRKSENMETVKRKLEEKDKMIRTELAAKERSISSREEQLRERLDQVTLAEREIEVKEANYERNLKKEVREQVKSEVLKLRIRFYELEGQKSALDERESAVKRKESAMTKQSFDCDHLNGELRVKTRQLEELKEENAALRTRLDQLGDYESKKKELDSLKTERSELRQELRNKVDENAANVLSHERKMKELERRLKIKNAEKVRSLEEKFLKLRQTYQARLEQWSTKYDLLVKELENNQLNADNLVQQNHLIAKEAGDLQSKLLRMSNSPENTNPRRRLSQVTCCSLCEDDKSESKLKSEASDLVRKAKLCIEEMKRESRLTSVDLVVEPKIPPKPLANDNSNLANGGPHVDGHDGDQNLTKSSSSEANTNGESDGYVDW